MKSAVKIEGGLMLAVRAPGQVAAQPNSSGAVVNRGAASGNKNFDPVTGKFAGKKIKAPGAAVVNQNPVAISRSGLPQGVTEEEWARRLDTVRAAARTSGTMDAAQVNEFLKGKVNDLSAVDVNQFVADVRAARIDDLSDILQSQFKDTTRGQVKLTAPKSYFKSVFVGLTDDEAASLIRRMQSRGWSKADIKKNILSKITDPARKKKLEQTYGEVKLGDWPDEPAVEFEDDEPKKPIDIALSDESKELLLKFASAMPAPIINLPEPKSVTKTIIRDPETKLILSVEETHNA